MQSTLHSTAIGFSQDGKQLVLASEGGGAPFLRDTSSGQETRLTGGGSGITELAVDQQGRSFVAAMEGGSAKLWDLATGQIIRTFECPGGSGATSVALAQSTALLATGCADGSAWLWDVNKRPATPQSLSCFTCRRMVSHDRALDAGRQESGSHNA